jgi:hypothetical protein
MLQMNMNGNGGIMNNVFGTLSRQYCLYFYILAVIGFIIFLIFFFYLFYLMFFIGKKIDSSVYVMTISGCISYLLFYFTYRLLHSMCNNSLR